MSMALSSSPQHHSNNLRQHENQQHPSSSHTTTPTLDSSEFETSFASESESDVVPGSIHGAYSGKAHSPPPPPNSAPSRNNNNNSSSSSNMSSSTTSTPSRSNMMPTMPTIPASPNVSDVNAWRQKRYPTSMEDYTHFSPGRRGSHNNNNNSSLRNLGSPCASSPGADKNNNNNNIAMGTTAAATTATTTKNTSKNPKGPKGTKGIRCYRLNLERPFNIHCEQSPLEYGDYMTPWEKEILPKTVGPVEYCPPRHLGGNVGIWRELMRFSSGGSSQPNSPGNVKDGEGRKGEDEEKIGSQDELNGTSPNDNQGEGCNESNIEGGGDPGNDNGGKKGPGGWRTLTEQEVWMVQKLGEVDPNTGEYTFHTYDLSHVVNITSMSAGGGMNGGGSRARSQSESYASHATSHGHSGRSRSESASSYLRSDNMMNESISASGRMATLNEDSMHLHEHFNGQPSTQSPIPREEQVCQEPQELHTVLSIDSETSLQEKLLSKTDEELAQDTARLFRRSELSLREAKEREEAELLRQKEEKERLEREEKERLEAEAAAASNLDGSMNGRGSHWRSHSRRKSSLSLGSTRKLLRSLSKVMTELNGTPTNSSSFNRSGSVNGSGVGARKLSSLQAATIEKARDLIDEESYDDDGDDEEEDLNDGNADQTSSAGNGTASNNGGQGAKKKPLNVSLYVIGEYDILNDLVNDGAKRLSRAKDNQLSDLELLLQNEPCPPPDRWVRQTGWSRCNPSSCYAACPPKGYVVEGVKNKVKIAVEETEGEVSRGLSSPATIARGAPPQHGAGATVSASTSSPRNNSTGTHTTESTAAVSTSTEGDPADATSRRGSVNSSLPNENNNPLTTKELSTPAKTAPKPTPSNGNSNFLTPPPSSKPTPGGTSSMSKASSHFNSKPSGGSDAAMPPSSSATKSRMGFGKRLSLFGKKNKQ